MKAGTWVVLQVQLNRLLKGTGAFPMLFVFQGRANVFTLM